MAKILQHHLIMRSIISHCFILLFFAQTNARTSEIQSNDSSFPHLAVPPLVTWRVAVAVPAPEVSGKGEGEQLLLLIYSLSSKSFYVCAIIVDFLRFCFILQFIIINGNNLIVCFQSFFVSFLFLLHNILTDTELSCGAPASPYSTTATEHCARAGRSVIITFNTCDTGGAGA